MLLFLSQLPIPAPSGAITPSTGIYQVEIRDQYGRLVTTLLRPMNKQFSLYRNRPGSCQFTMDLLDPQATPTNIKLNQYDVVFKRQGTPVFAGQISFIHPKVDDNDTKRVDIIATGYFDLFDQRYINSDFPGYDATHNQLPFSSVDSGAIAWDLVNYTQFPLTSDGTQQISGPTPTLCQSFVASGTANVTTIKLLVQNTSSSGSLVVGLYPDANGAPSNTIVPNSQKTISTGGIGSSLAWYEIDYSGTLPALTSGATYWIKAYLDTVQSGSNGIYWAYLNNGYYVNGKAFSPESPGMFSAGQDLQFFIQLDDNSWQMTKNSFLGIKQGTIQTSFNLSPVYDQYKKIKESVESLSSTYNGIDFNVTIAIDANNHMIRSFNVFYPRQGVDNTSLNFSYPGNIKKIEKPRDGKTMVNEVAMRGQGSGIDQLVEVQNDASSIQTYGLRQDVEHEADVSDSSTLTSIGQEFIRVRKDPLDLPNVVLDGNVAPSIGDYGVGDNIFINVSQAPLIDLSSSYRIEQIAVTISDDDQEEITLTLSSA